MIAVDALASRRAARINTTVQLSNAGITPGSGVGNSRTDISQSTLGVPVLSIGVPLVVRASTIVRDIISAMLTENEADEEVKKLGASAEALTEKQLDEMIVTPKEIDSIVNDMSDIVANAINIALFGDERDEIKSILS